MTDEQKQRYKENKRNKFKELNNGKIIITIIKDNYHFNDAIEL